MDELGEEDYGEWLKLDLGDLVGVEGTAMASVRMNTRFKPFDDVRVRRAMALATDYDGINAAVFEGLATRPRSIVPPIIPGHLASLPLVQPDAARAKALLAEAGFPDGIDVTLEYAGLEWWEELSLIHISEPTRPY